MDAQPPPSVRRRLVVALDGPGSSGKSSVGGVAARRLGYRFCDTGLLYRALTWLALQRGLSMADGAALATASKHVALAADPDGRLNRVVVDDRDVTEDVHTPSVDEHVSDVARLPAVRAALLERQRAIARSGGIIMAGRDIGSVVLPDADLKLYLEATVAERARRRTAQWGHPPDGAAAAEILADLRRRDAIDSNRPIAPLPIPPDAHVINSDGRAFEETVDIVEAEIRAAEAVASRTATRTTSRKNGPVDRSMSDRTSLFIRLTDWLGRTIVRTLTRTRIEGLDHARNLTGPVIVAANHVSNADGVLVASWITPALGRRIYLLGKQEALEWPLIGLGLRFNAVLGIRRGAADLEAFRAAQHVLDEGHVLGVFPEGTRSPSGALQHAKDGLAILALRTGATILPVGLGNTDRFWPRGGRPRFGGWVGLNVGRPFRLDEVTRGLSRREAQAAATAEIMGRIAGLLPPRQRGVYADAVREGP